MAIRRKINKKDSKLDKKVKLSLFADDMILYTENPKDASRKLLVLINEFGKVAGYKINAQKSLPFLYTNNKRSEREIGKQSPGEENGNLLQSSVWKRFIPRITV